MVKQIFMLALIVMSATFAFSQSKSAAAIERQLKILKADDVFALKYDAAGDNSKVYGFGADFGAEQTRRVGLESIRFGLAFFFAGKDLPVAPDEYTMTFQARGKKPKFAERHDLQFVIDGATLDLGAARYVNKNDGIEYLNFKLNREQLGKLAKGGEISAKLGGAELTLPAEQKKLFANLFALSDPKAK